MGDSFLDLLMAQEGDEAIVEAEGGGGVWVVADVEGGALAPVALEAVGVARTLADGLGAYVYAVLLGDGVTDLAQTLYQAGADGVRVADHPSLAPFAVTPYVGILADLLAAEQPEVVLLGATSPGRELAPRLAQRLGGGLVEGVVAVTLDEATRTIQASFPIYGGEYFQIAACPEARPQCFTVEPGAFSLPFLEPQRKGEPTLLEVEPQPPVVRRVGPAEEFDPPAVPLAQARAIVAAGRQVGDFGLAEQLAAAMGAQVAGDRGARDAGWVEDGQVVDVRGVEVAPQVYVALGVRGDTFHNAAIEGARFVLAVHPDPQASIFGVADVCIEAQPQDVVPALIEALK